MKMVLSVCLLFGITLSTISFAEESNSTSQTELQSIRNEVYKVSLLAEQGIEPSVSQLQSLQSQLKSMSEEKFPELVGLQKLVQGLLNQGKNLELRKKWEGTENRKDFELAPMTPGNDNCVSAHVVGNGTYSGHTTFANADGWATCDNSTSPDVWFLYTPQQNSTVVFSTAGSNYPTVLSIHNPNTNGCPGDPTDQIVCDDSSDFPPSSRIVLPVDTGSQYLIRVSGEGDDSIGSFVLTMEPAGLFVGTL